MLLIAAALVAVAVVALSRYMSLRDLANPFVVGLWYWIAFWMVGIGLGPNTRYAPAVGPNTVALIVLSFVAFTAGGLVASAVRQGRTVTRAAGYERPRLPDPPDAAAAGVMVVTGALLMVAFLIQAGGVPVLSEEAEQVRVDTRYTLGFLVISARWMLTLGVATLVAYAYGARRAWRGPVWLVVCLGALLIATIGSRAPVLLLIIAVGWVAVRSKATLPRWPLVLLGAVGAFVFLAVAAIFRAGEDLTLSLIMARMQWLAYVNATNLDRLLAFFPDSRGFLMGSSYVMDLSVLMPGHQPNFGEWLKQAMGLTFPGGGITIGLVGESYANWGPLGSVILAALFGALMAWWSATQSFRNQEEPLRILLAFGLGGAVIQSGLVPALVNNVVPLVATLAVMRMTRLDMSHARASARGRRFRSAK